mmetsp:Transcript_93015/g.161212  ORF Transcript_93015/g.161212 Transcript_93015/m.161212 type:complete len:233 (-) Transcript_93015:1066-1764(-)
MGWAPGLGPATLLHEFLPLLFNLREPLSKPLEILPPLLLVALETLRSLAVLKPRLGRPAQLPTLLLRGLQAGPPSSLFRLLPVQPLPRLGPLVGLWGLGFSRKTRVIQPLVHLVPEHDRLLAPKLRRSLALQAPIGLDPRAAAASGRHAGGIGGVVAPHVVHVHDVLCVPHNLWQLSQPGVQVLGPRAEGVGQGVVLRLGWLGPLDGAFPRWGLERPGLPESGSGGGGRPPR